MDIVFFGLTGMASGKIARHELNNLMGEFSPRASHKDAP